MRPENLCTCGTKPLCLVLYVVEYKCGPLGSGVKVSWEIDCQNCRGLIGSTVRRNVCVCVC